MKNSIFAFFIGVLVLCSTSVRNFSQKLAEADKVVGASADKNSKTEEKSEKSKGLIERNWRLRRGAIERTIEHGNAPFNPSNFAGPKEYDVYGRDLYQANIRFGRVIGTKKGVTYQYLFGATPLALFTRNEIRNPAYVSEKETPHAAPTVRQKTYGVGVQPVNFRFIFLPKSRLKPYAQTGAGVLFTTRSMPVPRSTPFNFTGDFGGGVLYMLSQTKAVNVGYRYFHISNGNIGGKINNPGYNANVFYFSYSSFK